MIVVVDRKVTFVKQVHVHDIFQIQQAYSSFHIV